MGNPEGYTLNLVDENRIVFSYKHPEDCVKSRQTPYHEDANCPITSEFRFGPDVVSG